MRKVTYTISEAIEHGWSQRTLYRQMADGSLDYVVGADGVRRIYIPNPIINYIGTAAPAGRDAKILKRLRAGETQRAVAAEFGMTHQRIAQIAKKNGIVSPRDRNRPR